MFPKDFTMRSLHSRNSDHVPIDSSGRTAANKDDIPVPLESLVVDKLKSGELSIDERLTEGEWSALVSWLAESPSQVTAIDVDLATDSKYLPAFLDALSRNNKITTLVMRGDALSEKVSWACARLLSANATIMHLRLDGNWSENECAGFVYQAMYGNKALKTLTIDNPQFGETSMQELTTMLKVNRSINTVSISGVAVSDSAAGMLAGAIKSNGAVKRLLIASCKMSNFGLNQVAHGILKNQSLTQVGLPEGGIDKKTEVLISDALRANENRMEHPEAVVARQFFATNNGSFFY